MNENQKIRLERNLSKSASGAKPYWPRVLIGPGVEKQGYIDPKLLPIEKDVNLGSFYADQMAENAELARTINALNEIILSLQISLQNVANENKSLKARILALEGFKLD